MADDRKNQRIRQSNGINASIADGTLMNFTCITTLWSYIFGISFKKFQSLVKEGKSLKFRQSNGNDSAMTDDTPVKLQCITFPW